MTIFEAGKYLVRSLSGVYEQRESANIANMVMEKITGLSNIERLMKKNLELKPEQSKLLQNYNEQLLQHKPIQYVLNETWFAGMRFFVNENVLIPRPETEELVTRIIENVRSSGRKNVVVLDIGTGSGCIAIAIKKNLPDAQVYALDISKKALKIAKKNAALNQVSIQFMHADILNHKLISNLSDFDIIVSNPPYVTENESNLMQSNVLLFEPHEALFVPDNDALVFYRAIADFALQHLNPSGKLYFEINEMLGDEVAALLKSKNFSGVNIRKDMQGKPRMIDAVLL